MDQIGAVHAALASAAATVATAESCTGGILATWLTERPGSSAYFLGGVSAYANAAKETLLGVPRALIERHGAVSAEVAAAMAKGAKERFASTYGLALTGIAGPGGGSADKPVGTVYCGVAGPRGERSVRLALAGDRGAIRLAAARAALDELMKEL
jgi:nicotinamide-nucleotide amidase